ncbi:MAG: hypothetical protein HYZ09_00350 [Candidatus Kerfeldbacteria bacterium]|nr:hypothetical protein [Candidatus Kerfeldbacteria bacterium]
MYLTTHAAVGVLIAQQTTNPWLAFFGAFLSHYVLDFVPHGDENLGPEDFSDETIRAWVEQKKGRIILLGIIDFTGIALLVFGLSQTIQLPTFNLLLLGIIGSILPDFFVSVFPGVYTLTKRHWFIRAVHWSQRKILLDPVIRRLNTFHRWIHNPLHERLPVKMSQEIGVVVQFFILFLFLATELVVLGK